MGSAVQKEVLAEWTKVKEQIEPEFDERVSAEADPVESFNAAFATLEVAIQDVKGDSWRRVVNELGEDRIFRLVSRLKSAIDDYGTPRQRRAGVQSAADRAEARAQGKV